MRKNTIAKHRKIGRKKLVDFLPEESGLFSKRKWTFFQKKVDRVFEGIKSNEVKALNIVKYYNL